ncbi:MAG: Zn-dependent hydrolase [Thermoleophilaceae bacterium]|nr:Zn-dependent hydrolase [Thermoleophilaceae bacterium]
MTIDARRVIADLRELDRLTGGPDGARRVCWTKEWLRARELLRERLEDVGGVAVAQDEAGNLWATLPGDRDGTVAVGSHLDSVPNGGWLDGALGVMAALEVLRAAAADSHRHTAALVDFADEEGARFGRSLFGSSAVAGTLDTRAIEGLRDAEGGALGEVLAEHGVDLERTTAATARRESLIAYLELHIEQGPVLEGEGLPVAAVSGTFGVERYRFSFDGQASHAGTTPMDMRRDAGLAAAGTALAVEQIARRHEGVGTCGRVDLEPGIPTAVAGRADLLVDLRHAQGEPLAAMLAETRAEAARAAAGRGCSMSDSELWRIEPISFDGRLVTAALEAACTGRALPSGALHDAAEMARHLPAAMMFTSSTRGISHAKEEDTPEPDLERAIDAFGRLALRVLRGEVLG